MDLEALYHRAPYPARVVAASARGLILARRRYGAETDRLVEAALDREQWSAAEWHAYRAERLARVLAIARERVPAYRQAATPSADPFESLARWPLLEKATLRGAPRTYVRRDPPPHLVTEHTSGTTGTPLWLTIDREAYRHWYALSIARWRNWYGVTRQDRWGIVGGQPVVPPGSAGPPFWVWNAALRQLYLSTYHVGPRTAADYVRAIDRHRLTYLLGYPSSLHALAVACQRQGIRPRPLRAVVANAEPVLAHQRAAIHEVFGCPVRETYGMAEYVAAASECDHGSLHLWPEVGVLEVVDGDGAPVPADTLGRFACTGLLNSTMPLVRYLVGDAGRVAPPDEPCGCGRTLPILREVEGRMDDLVHTVDGRVLGRLDPVFKGDLPLEGAQIVQEELDRFRVLVVPAPGYGPAAAESIVQRLRDRVGDVRVTVEEVHELPLGANGKFKAVVSRVDAPG